jgi:hypothetical protein
MLGHQFGQDLVFGLDFLLQILDPFLFRLLAGSRPGLKSRRPVLEEFLLPAVEHRGLQAMLVTKLRDRLLLQ